MKPPQKRAALSETQTSPASDNYRKKSQHRLIDIGCYCLARAETPQDIILDITFRLVGVDFVKLKCYKLYNKENRLLVHMRWQFICTAGTLEGSISTAVCRFLSNKTAFIQNLTSGSIKYSDILSMWRNSKKKKGLFF